jgi:thioredoxin-like negative regulator of GroEL
MTMIPLPNHEAFEAMLRPRKNVEGYVEQTYPEWVCICFSATWCGPCKRLDKTALVAATPGIVWYSCDVDENNHTLGFCGLHSIPGFCLIKNGNFKDRKTGASSVQDVLNWLVSNGVSN